MLFFIFTVLISIEKKKDKKYFEFPLGLFIIFGAIEFIIEFHSLLNLI